MYIQCYVSNVCHFFPSTNQKPIEYKVYEELQYIWLAATLKEGPFIW
jgi:hypothetical protein